MSLRSFYCKAKNKIIKSHAIEKCAACKALRRKNYRKDGRDKWLNKSKELRFMQSKSIAHPLS